MSSKKPAKIASQKKAPAAKVVRQCAIELEDWEYVARDVTTARKVSAGPTHDRCRFLAGFRHGYEVVR